MHSQVLFSIWLCHQAVLLEATSIRVDVVGSLTLHAPNPKRLTEETAILSFKIGLGLLAGFDLSPEMVEASVLWATATLPKVQVDYCVMIPSHVYGADSSAVAAAIVKYITSEPDELATKFETVLSAAGVGDEVSYVRFGTPIVEERDTELCNFRYWRFMPIKVRSEQNNTGVALGELTLYDAAGTNISVTQANVIGAYGSVVPFNAFDGKPLTDWHSNTLLPLQVDFGGDWNVAYYKWFTASAASSADPVRWRLEASTDALRWHTVDEHVLADYLTPPGRGLQAGFFGVECSGALIPSVAGGANAHKARASPLLIFGLLLSGMACCAFSVGCYIFSYRRCIYSLKALEGKMGKQAAWEEDDLEGKMGKRAAWEEEDDLEIGKTGLQAVLEEDDERGHLQPVKVQVSPKNGGAGDDSSTEVVPAAVDTVEKQSSRYTVEKQSSLYDGDDRIPQGMERGESLLYDDCIPRGMEVCITGLTSRPQDNGTLAEVLHYNVEKEMYLVRILETKRKVMLRPENVALTLQDSPEQPRPASALSPPRPWTPASASSQPRPEASLQPRSEAASKPPSPAASQPRSEADAFPPGTQVVIIGLIQSPDDNGTACEVIKYDVEKRMYRVKKLKTGEEMSLNPENVILAFCQNMLDDLGP